MTGEELKAIERDATSCKQPCDICRGAMLRLIAEVRRLKWLLTGQHEIKGGLELETEALRSEVHQLKAKLAAARAGVQ